MRPSYKVIIIIGAIRIPVSLYNVAKTNDSKFKLIDRKTMSKIQYRKVATNNNNQEIVTEDVIKGYEYEKNQFVVFSNEELDILKNGFENQIIIQEFVKKNEIKYSMLNKAYYIRADEGYDSGLTILEKALKRTKLVAIAKTILGNKEHLICIVEERNQLMLYTMYFSNDIYDTNKNLKIKAEKHHLDIAINLFKLLERPFIINKYHDEFQKRIDRAVPLKINGETIKRENPKPENVIDNLTCTLQEIIISLKDK